MTTFASPATVLDGADLREALLGLCRGQGWGAPQGMRMRVLKPHERRSVFELAVETDRGEFVLIGKTYARDRSDVFRAMGAIRDAGFGPGAEYSIPQPFAYLPSLGLRLEEKVPGFSARDVLLTGSPAARRETVARCARWLARFQTAAPRLTPPTTVDAGTEWRRWQAWADELAGFAALAPTARALLDRLRATAATLRPRARPVAAHGSYIPGHVIVNGPRTVAIDFDRYGVEDPAWEVAGFVVALQRLALKELGSLSALAEAVEAFVDAYVTAGGEAVTHIGFYQAVECLRRARRDVHGRTPPGLESAERMLDEGLRALAKGVS